MIDNQYELLFKELNDLSEKDPTAFYFLVDNIDFVDRLSQGAKWTDAAYKNLLANAEEKGDALMKILIIYKYIKDHGVVS